MKQDEGLSLKTDFLHFIILFLFLLAALLYIKSALSFGFITLLFLFLKIYKPKQFHLKVPPLILEQSGDGKCAASFCSCVSLVFIN